MGFWEETKNVVRLYGIIEEFKVKRSHKTIEGKTLMELLTAHEVVLAVLKRFPKTRDSDALLKRVVNTTCSELGLRWFSRMTRFAGLGKNYRMKKDPDGSFIHPDIQPSPDVREARRLREKTHKAFFLNKSVINNALDKVKT